MPRADYLTRETPFERFNRMSGGQVWKPSVRRVDTDADRGSIVRRIARGSPSIRSSTASNYRRAVSGQGGGFRANPARVESAIQGVFQRLTDDYQENIAERDAVTRIDQTNDEQTVADRPWYGDLWHSISGIGEENEEGGFSDSIVGRALDVASRPAYGVFEGLQSLAEQEDHTGFSPGDLWHSIQNFGAGFGRGFTGEDKTGFGQVYESYKDNPTTAFGGALREFEANHPALEQNVARGVGLAGELGLDPLNYLIPAAPTVMRDTGKVASADVFRETLLRAAGEVTDDFATGSHLVTGAYANNPSLLTSRVRNSIDDLFNQANVEVQGGGSRARRTMNSRVWPALVANRTQEEIFQATTEFFSARVDDLWARGSVGGYSPMTVDTFRRYSNDFDEFWTALDNELVNRGVISATATTDDILDALKSGKISRRVFEGVRTEVLNKYAPELQATFDAVFAATKNPTYRTLGVRIGNKTIPFRAVGRAYDYIATKLADNLIPNRADTFERTFYENAFPGIFGLKASQARAFGLNAIDAFRKDMQEFARNYSGEQAIELQRLLERGVHTTGNQKIDDGLKFLRDWYDNIFREEQALGARPSRGTGSQFGDNYTYIYNRGGSVARRTAFKEGRKSAWNNPHTVGPEKYTLDYAKAQGLRPVENAFENLFLRRAKMGRDSVRAAFLQDLLDNYSIWGGKPTRKLPKAERIARNLEEVPYNRLNQNFRQMVDNTGGTFYLPKEIKSIADKFDEISGWTSSEWGALGRSYAKVVNTLKALLTLPFTGFHTKNFLGDVYLGLMDDINPADYSRVAKKFLANQAGRVEAASFNIIPGHLKYSWDEMYGIFLENADAGFFNVEFGTYNSITAGSIPRRVGRKAVNKLREWSDNRETIPRFVHFTTAYKEEAAALWNKGIRDMARIEQEAANAALWRVNHYKFDYSALLPWEKSLKTLAFPFYTYLRKAMPTLIEQMYMNPRYLTAVSRFMQYNDGSGADAFNEMNVPQWIRDLGFGVLSDEKEPMAVTADILPLGAMDILSSMSPNELNPTNFDPADLFREMGSNLNPILQAPLEYATGQTLFDERPVQGDFGQYIMENLPFVNDFQEEVVDIPGMPGGGQQNNALWDYAFGEGDRPLWESLTNNRFAGVGLPIRRIREGQQFQQQQENVDRLIDEPLQQFNRSQDRFVVSQTERFTYRVTDKTTRVELGEYNTPREAIEAASRYPQYQAPQGSPYSPPDMNAIIQSLSQ